MPTALTVVDGVDLTGKTCVITGASSRLGRESARALASGGAGLGAAYLADCRVRDDVAPYAVDEPHAARLWELSESLCSEGVSQ